MQKVKANLLTVLKCVVQWHQVHSRCSVPVTTAHFHSSSSPQTETLSPARDDPASPLLQRQAASHLSVVCLYDSDFSKDRVIPYSGVTQSLSFGDWLTLLSMMFSRFILAVVCIRISFLNIPLYAYSIFCLSIRLLVDMGYFHLSAIVSNYWCYARGCTNICSSP